MQGLQSENMQLNPHIDFLESKINPTLDKAIEKLIEHLMSSDEIQKHQEKLKEKRVLDRIEQRKIEKQRLREELGSQYSSSSEEESFSEEFGDHNSLLQENSGEKMAAHPNNGGPMGELVIQPSSESKPFLNVMNDGQNLVELADEEEEEDEEDYEMAKERELSRLKKQRAGFNAVKFLAETLRQLHTN